ncbi:MAG: hypothetical protein FWC39_11295 [Bacteroidetes bacterium]|nr:hypothetical protein [Bacteroidota bacterium]
MNVKLKMIANTRNFFILLWVCLNIVGCKNSPDINVKEINLDKEVATQIDNLLKNDYSTVFSYTVFPVKTPESVFQDIAKRNVQEKDIFISKFKQCDVFLCPNLTYKLTDLTVSSVTKNYEAMGYYVVKEDKLMGVGLIFNETVEIGGLIQKAIGYRAKFVKSWFMHLLGLAFIPCVIWLILSIRNWRESGFGIFMSIAIIVFSIIYFLEVIKILT